MVAGRTVIDGPFAETSELVAGFSIWEVKDMDEAVAWAKRCPNPMSGPSEIEIRPFFEAADLAEFLTPEELSTPREGSAVSSASPEGVGRRAAELLGAIPRRGIFKRLRQVIHHRPDLARKLP